MGGSGPNQHRIKAASSISHCPYPTDLARKWQRLAIRGVVSVGFEDGSDENPVRGGNLHL
ncbi:protein of unknown function [Magnetospirillum sp. XM-1]|nr:protein of unknown function [Magnetospirillum sp. XM-1]